MKVGDLVKLNTTMRKQLFALQCRYPNDIGIVVGEWTHDDSGEEHTLVRWIAGRHVGDTDAILPRYLEVLCK